MIKGRYTYTFAMFGLFALTLGCHHGIAKEIEETEQAQDVIVLTVKEAEEIVNVLEEITARYVQLKSGDRASLNSPCSVGTACGTAGVCGYSDDLLLQQILAAIACVKKELDYICENLVSGSGTDALIESLIDIIASATTEIINTQTACCANLTSQINVLETTIIDTILDVEVNIMNNIETCCASLTSEINNTELSLISSINSATTSIINTQTACCASLAIEILNANASVISSINTASTSIINTQTACCASLATQIVNVQTSLVSVINTATTNIIVNAGDCCDTTTSLIDRIELILRGLLC